MPIERETRPMLRLALGLGVAGLIGWGRGGPFAYILPMLALLLLAQGGPPPGLRQVIALLVITALSCLWGLLMAPLLTYAAPAGVLLILIGVALAGFLASRNPALAVPLKLFIIGDTLIAVIAFKSQALAQVVALQLLGDIALAVMIAWGVATLLPDRADQPAVPPPPVPAPLEMRLAGWIGLRSALVMVLPVVLALQNPGLFLMTLLNGAQLAQQPNATLVQQNGLAIVTSTAAGGVMALVFWGVLGWWPGLVLLVGGIALVALCAAPRIYGATATAASRAWWPAALSTLILVLGTTVADSAIGTDIWVLTLRRITVMLALAVVAAAMVWALDHWRDRRLRLNPTPIMGET
jgi:hypothetical protein